jgi:hypothetical protein
MTATRAGSFIALSQPNAPGALGFTASGRSRFKAAGRRRSLLAGVAIWRWRRCRAARTRATFLPTVSSTAEACGYVALALAGLVLHEIETSAPWWRSRGFPTETARTSFRPLPERSAR